MVFRPRVKTLSATTLLFALLLLTLLVPVAHAQDYSFNVPENRVDVFIEPDGTIWLIYDITFAPDPGSHPIDVVDLGMPNSTYNLSSIRASVDGMSVSGISRSPYVTPGIAVDLGAQTIPPGEVGTVHIEAAVRDLIYPDTEDEEYASFEFAPTWFDSQFVSGRTRLEVNFHLPLGVTEEEPRYHDEPFTEAYFLDDRVVYSWIDEQARADRQYVFGASFPRKYLEEGVVQQPPASSSGLGSFIGSIFGGAFCSSPICWFFLFGAGWVFMATFGSWRKRQRRMQYLPPELSVEGTGVKRGLTAVEAAILLEAPLNRVVTMILFGLVKKGTVTVESEDPLKLIVTDPLPKDIKLWYYERRFLTAIKDNGKLDEDVLQETIIDLIGDVNKKLAGFSRKETKAYYKDIAARAWSQVEAADTPEVLGERWGDGLEWTMIEDDWDDRTRRVFQDRPVVMPHWWWYYRPWHAHAGGATRPSTPAPAPAGGGTPVTLPTLPGADFANTVVTGVENAANSVVTRVESFTGKVTQTTNPPPKPSSSSRSGGGYSCACACACAGCACACAGGGR